MIKKEVWEYERRGLLPNEEGSRDTHGISHMLALLLLLLSPVVVTRRKTPTSTFNAAAGEHPSQNLTWPNSTFSFLFSISHLGIPVSLKVLFFFRDSEVLSDTLCLEQWEQGKGARKRMSTRKKSLVLPRNRVLPLPLTPTKVPS